MIACVFSSIGPTGCSLGISPLDFVRAQWVFRPHAVAHTSSPLFFGDLGAMDPTFKITCKDDGLVFGGICPNMECMNYSRGSNTGAGGALLLHSPLQRHPSLPVSIFNSAPFQLAQLYGAPHIMSPSKEISRPIIYAGSLISPPLLRCSLYPERDNGCLGRTQWEKVAFVLRSRCSGMTVFGAGTLARSHVRARGRTYVHTPAVPSPRSAK